MENRELAFMLNAYFKWNKCRMDCFVGMLLALIKVITINLTELACGFASLASIESRYKRIRRFFTEFTIDFTRLAVFIVWLSVLPLNVLLY